MYLLLYDIDDFPYYVHMPSEKNYCYRLSDERYRLLLKWHDHPSLQDQIVSGVLTDWIDEHREELLEWATGPSDPAARLDQLVDDLRLRFSQTDRIV